MLAQSGGGERKYCENKLSSHRGEATRVLSHDEISTGDSSSRTTASVAVSSPPGGGADSVVGAGDGAAGWVGRQGDLLVSSTCDNSEGATFDKPRRTLFAGREGE